MIRFNVLSSFPEPIDSSQLREKVKVLIQAESKTVGELNYVFCDDDYLHQINEEFLHHDTLTDIITFNRSQSAKVISGEIYISLERVLENAAELGQSFYQELTRVVIHGVLHLVGYDDKTDAQKIIMRGKEDYYINLQPRTKR